MKVRRVWSALQRALPVVAVMLVGVSGSGVIAAQGAGLMDDTTYVLETTGEEVTWDDPWAFDEDISEVGDGYEIIALTGGASSLLISVLPNGLDIEEARDLVLDEFQAGTDAFATIDRGAYDNISYSLDLADVGGVELGVFTLFRGGSGDMPTFAYIFISSIQGFADGFAGSQEEIAIDGDPIFDGVDGAGLQDQLEQNRGSVGGSDGSDDPTAEPDEETPIEDEETPDDEDRETQEPDEATEETDGDERGGEPIDDEYIELGVVENGLYESPQFDTEITWSSDWAINENVDEPVVSDTRGNVDLLVLNGEDNTYLSVQVQEAGEVTPADLVGLWTSQDFLDSTETEGTEPDEVVLDDADEDSGAVVVLADLEDGTQIVVYREALLVDGGDTIAIIQLFQVVEGAEDGIVAAQEGVEVDGEPILTFFDVEDVVNAAG